MTKTWIEAVMIGCVLTLGAGCAATQDPSGYGYEFIPEPVTASPAAAPPPANVGPDRIAPETIQARVRSALPTIRRCYDDARARTPELAGSLMLSFRIRERGTVDGAFVESSSLADAAVRDCAVEAIGALAFPKSPAGVVDVRYPLDFQP